MSNMSNSEKNPVFVHKFKSPELEGGNLLFLDKSKVKELKRLYQEDEKTNSPIVLAEKFSISVKQVYYYLNIKPPKYKKPITEEEIKEKEERRKRLQAWIQKHTASQREAYIQRKVQNLLKLKKQRAERSKKNKSY